MLDLPLEILHGKYRAELESAEYELQLLLDSENAIPDHTCFIDSVDQLIEKLEKAKSKLDAIAHAISIRDVKED